jgi:hypothetical protein
LLKRKSKTEICSWQMLMKWSTLPKILVSPACFPSLSWPSTRRISASSRRNRWTNFWDKCAKSVRNCMWVLSQSARNNSSNSNRSKNNSRDRLWTLLSRASKAKQQTNSKRPKSETKLQFWCHWKPFVEKF